MADLALVRRWLTQFGRLTSAWVSPDEAADYLDAFVPMLAMRFDDRAFTPVSLEHVAAQCKHLPTYGELVPLLAGWRREQLESERIAIEYGGRGPARAREYKLPPPPDWARTAVPTPLSQLIRPPLRSVAEQLEALGFPANAEKPPLRAVAAEAPQEVRRGPVVEEEDA